MIEMLVSVSLLLTLIVVVGSSVRALKFTQSIRTKAYAYSLVSEQLDYWRIAPYDQLANQTSQPFQGILYPKGKFVIDSTTTRSGTHAIKSSEHNGTSGITAQIVPPIGPLFEDGSITLYAYIPTATPSPWSFGSFIRSKDEKNGYLLTASNTGISFSKKVNDVTTSLYNAAYAFAEDTWYKVECTASGTSFSIKINDVAINGTPISLDIAK